MYDIAAACTRSPEFVGEKETSEATLNSRYSHVNLTQCPYDATDIAIESYEGGVYLVVCECCGAQWETHGSWVARVTEPDWDIVKAFQEIQSLQTTLD